MIVQVTGDRNWRDALVIYSVVAEIADTHDATLRSGDAMGADIIADVCAQIHGWKVERYPAEWKKFGPSAGPKRNQLMVDLEPKADLAIAFHPDLGKSKGTKDMLMRCLNNDIKSFLFSGGRFDRKSLDELRSYVEGL